MLVRGVVSSVGIEWFNLWFLFTVRRDWGFNVANKAGKGSSGSKAGWFASWYVLARSKELIIECCVILKVLC